MSATEIIDELEELDDEDFRYVMEQIKDHARERGVVIRVQL